MATTKVTRGGQITLTKDVREKLGIKEGDKLILHVSDRSIIVTKRDPKVFDEVSGFLPDNFDEILKKIRSDSNERLKRLGIIK